MVHLAPPEVRNENVAIVAVLLDDLDLEPYIDGEPPTYLLENSTSRVVA